MALLICTDTCILLECSSNHIFVMGILQYTTLLPIFCVSLPLPPTHIWAHLMFYVLAMSSLCLFATGYTRVDLKALELGKEELHVLDLKLKALIMDCSHFIDLVQQLLACSSCTLLQLHLHSPLYCPSSHLLCLHGHT